MRKLKEWFWFSLMLIGGYAVCVLLIYLTHPIAEVVSADARATLEAVFRGERLQIDPDFLQKSDILTWLAHATMAWPSVALALVMPKRSSVPFAMNMLTALILGLCVGSSEFIVPRVSWPEFFLWAGIGLIGAVLILSIRLSPTKSCGEKP